METSALAVRLGASPQMIQAMLEHLQRVGLIRSYSSCQDGCQGCILQESCHIDQGGSQVRLWQSNNTLPMQTKGEMYISA